MLHDGIHVVTAEEMRSLDQYTIENIGIPGAVLMENAGKATVEALEDFFEIEFPVRVAIFAGKGNNGGDGFVIARHLEMRGHEAVVYLLAELDDLSGDAAIMARAAVNCGVIVREIPGANALGASDFDPAHYDFVVDAVFGTGLTSAIRGHAVGAVDMINSSGLPVVAVDMPSGLSSDSGELPGPAVHADLTVTFAYPKRGLILAPASTFAGEVVVADIGIPAPAGQDKLQTALITRDMIRTINLERDENSHKGSYGHVCVVAGSRGKSGAAALTGMAVLRAGAGLTTVACPDSLVTSIPQIYPALMTLSLEETGGGISRAAVKSLEPHLGQFSALAVGPGLGSEEEQAEAIRKLVEGSTIPVVLDADGINAYAGKRQLLAGLSVPLIITPHPGEMARLMDCSVAEVQADRLEISRALAEELDAIVVLKGHGTVVAEPGGEVYINSSGNAGMATAGSGDVLTGMIASLLGRDFTPLESAVAAVYLHGLAGDAAVEEIGMAALTATDILDFLPEAFAEVEEH